MNNEKEIIQKNNQITTPASIQTQQVKQMQDNPGQDIKHGDIDASRNVASCPEDIQQNNQITTPASIQTQQVKQMQDNPGQDIKYGHPDASRDVVNCPKERKSIIKNIYEVIQAIANIAVIIALIFTMANYISAVRPILQEQRLIKAQALCYSGQFKEAVNLYKSILLRDNPIALNNLGHINEYGLDVTQDKEKAKDYYRKASAKGSEIAVNNLIRQDIEDFSPESQEELILIFRSAYEMKNEKLVRFALSLISINIKENELIFNSTNEEEYGSLFRNNAAEYREKFKEFAEHKEEGKWVRIETVYTPTGSKAFTGTDMKLLYEGAEAGKPGEYYGILYKYGLYKLNPWRNLIKLEYGMEKAK